MKRKAILLLMLLLMCLLLSSCYKEVDPWPSSAPVTTELAVTVTPTTEAALPSPEPTTVETDWADEQPTAVPGGNTDPGFNG